MSKWFLIVLAISFLAAIIAIFARIEDQKEIERLENGDLSADDFEIIE